METVNMLTYSGHEEKRELIALYSCETRPKFGLGFGQIERHGLVSGDRPIQIRSRNQSAAPRRRSNADAQVPCLLLDYREKIERAGLPESRRSNQARAPVRKKSSGR